MALPVAIIFDIGKTNKKILLFNEQYKVIWEESFQFEEIVDEDGFPCENINALTVWLKESLDQVVHKAQFDIKAVNFSAYGASFVYVDKQGNVLPPLYNYLKPYPEKLQKQFYDKYGDEFVIAKETASPVLGSLNSGMQLYRMKYEKAELFKKIAIALHLPQYLSYIITDFPCSDITSIGCHTSLWDFKNSKYHDWVIEEGLEKLFPSLLPSDTYLNISYNNKNFIAGIGLHDSSAALIPYLRAFHEPFILLSTGTWCISLNPFNHFPLTVQELQLDCLCYLSYQGKPVKASRLFAGNEHDQQVKRLDEHFNKRIDYYKTLIFDTELSEKIPPFNYENHTRSFGFISKNLNDFKNYEEAYYHLISDIIAHQRRSTQLVLEGSAVKRIFVDGGFSKNPIYMNLLAHAFPHLEVFAATISQAPALGAALAIHSGWNNNPIQDNIIKLQFYGNKKPKAIT